MGRFNQQICTINSGAYTGNGTANKGIPHGLSCTPVMVSLTLDASVAYLNIIKGGRIDYMIETKRVAFTVTEFDSVNFYVGNSTNYGESGNGNTVGYHWVAIS